MRKETSEPPTKNPRSVTEGQIRPAYATAVLASAVTFMPVTAPVTASDTAAVTTPPAASVATFVATLVAAPSASTSVAPAAAKNVLGFGINHVCIARPGTLR